MPTTHPGKTIAARNATTHGLFSRDVVLPALGEDPEGYKLLEDQWMQQLPPRTLLERHYVEKIAAASWRLRRLHRWQAQILENAALTEDEQLDKLSKVLRHETTLHRQIDTSVRMLSKDAPQLYTQRAMDTVLADTRTARREYQSYEEDAVNVELQVQDHLYRIRKATEAAALALADAPLDTTAVPDTAAETPLDKAAVSEADFCEADFCEADFCEADFCEADFCEADFCEADFCENELAPAEPSHTLVLLPESCVPQPRENCQNEPPGISLNPFRLSEYLEPGHRHHPLPFSPPPGHAAKITRNPASPHSGTKAAQRSAR